MHPGQLSKSQCEGAQNIDLLQLYHYNKLMYLTIPLVSVQTLNVVKTKEILLQISFSDSIFSLPF